VLDRLPIRWKLAGISAALTFVILCGFASVVGELTARQIRQDFNNELVIATDELARILQVRAQFSREGVRITGCSPTSTSTAVRSGPSSGSWPRAGR
jgi:hypothetical protein